MLKDTSAAKVQISGINYWFCAIGIIILFACIHSRKINTPFSGLHSWGQATGAWAMRSHVNYGYGFTKGVTTWAVGNPPTENPKRYFDHPNLGSFLAGITGKIFGAKESTLRIVDILNGIVIFLIFLRIVKGLMDEKTALLAGLIYAILPITGYFAMGGYTVVLGFGGIYFYLVLIRALRDGPAPGLRHKIGLAACLFLGLQISWTGFFYAFAIGLHYVCQCLRRKSMPDWSLIRIMIIAPFASLAVTFTTMAAGYDWDVSKIIDLYKWRAGNAEVAAATAPFDWGKWFAKLWEFSLTNYTLPIVLAAIAYITIGQLIVFSGSKDETTGRFRNQFPQFWLFAIVPVTQLFTLRGCLWKHQTWLHPFDPFVAIAAALVVMMVFDMLKKINLRVAVIGAVALVCVFVGFCMAGTNYYYDIRWQPQVKIDMFKMLNEKIPPDEYLLSFEELTVNQHASKGGFYRPEIAWYLDREIVPARSIAEIQKYAATGKYPYYLIPNVTQLQPFVKQLVQMYNYQFVPGSAGKRTKAGKFLQAGMTDYLIFDLKNKK